ncbi:MAG: DUF2007 domain-containing protein [Flavobacteriaceae bacterium]|nr:DUF2007 domain-containing protein [Flavobacteriaceae bacterium]
MENSNNKLVTVLTSRDLFELQIAQGKLESEGIQSFIADQNMNTVGFLGEYRLQIASSDVIVVKNILNKIS